MKTIIQLLKNIFSFLFGKNNDTRATERGITITTKRDIAPKKIEVEDLNLYDITCVSQLVRISTSNSDFVKHYNRLGRKWK